MLLVNGKNTSLNDKQKAFLKAHKSNTVYVIGGTGAVSQEIQFEAAKTHNVVRLAGKTRYETSVLIAETFFKNPTKVIIAYSHDYPDGLCAGPLGYALKAPVLLIKQGNETAAYNYCRKYNIHSAYVTGGEAKITGNSLEIVFEQ